MNGHKFVQRQFYQIILCAFCNEFLLNAVGYQCEDCRYTCHKKCYEKVVTKCISKSNIGVCAIFFSLNCLLSHIPHVSRMTTLRRSTIESRIDSNRSLTSAQTGVAIVDTCFLWVVRMLVAVPNAISLAMPIAHIWYRISAVCLWRPPTNCSETGEISTKLAAGALLRPPVHPSRLSHIPILARHKPILRSSVLR